MTASSRAGDGVLLRPLTGVVTSDGGFINRLSGGATVTATSGTTTLSLTNSYTGATTIENGATLTGANNNALSATSATTVKTGGTLDLGGLTQTVNSVSLTGGVIKTGTLTSTNGILSSGGTITSLTINGGVTSLKTTGGTTTLTGTNNFSGNVSNVRGAKLVNKGNTTDALINNGDMTNDPGATYRANVTNSGGATLTNIGTWIGAATNELGSDLANNGSWTGSVTNDATSTFSNGLGATLDGALTNSGTATNGGTIKRGVRNNATGTFTTTGAIEGGVTNAGVTLASGSISGTIVNTKTFQVVNPLTGDGTSTFFNDANGLLAVAQNFTNVGAVSNASTVDIGVGFQLATTGVYLNKAGATTFNGGTLTATGGVINLSTNFSNSSSGEIKGAVTNGNGNVAARFVNEAGAKGAGGKITGNVTNNRNSVFENNGVVSGDFTNHGVLNAQNTITGVIDNTGTLNLTGTLDPSVTNNWGVTNLFSFNLISPTFNNNAGGVLTSINGMITGTLHNNPGGAIELRTGATPIFNTLNVTGNYSGGGAMLISDTLTSAGAVRGGRLFVGGAGSGDTGVYVTPVGPTSYYNNPILVAKINALGGRFLLANAGSINQGALKFRIEELAPGEWYLFPTLDTQVFTAVGNGIISTMTSQTSFFQGAAPFVTSPLSATPNQPHTGLWVRSSVGRDDVSSHAVSTGVKGDQWSEHKLRTMFDGYQVGADFAVWNVQNTKFNLHGGVTTGQYFANTFDIKGSGTSASFNIPYVGVYGVLAGNGFFSDVLFRHDFWSSSVNNQNAGLIGRGLYGHGWAGSANVGYRIVQVDKWFVEPSAGVHVNAAKFGDLPVVAGTTPAFVAFNTVRSTLGRAGVRVGTNAELAGMALQPYVSLSAWREFEGDARQNFIQDTMLVPMTSTRVGTFGQVGAGVAAQIIGTDLVGFLRGDHRFGGNITGGTLNGGIRYTF